MIVIIPFSMQGQILNFQLRYCTYCRIILILSQNSQTFLVKNDDFNLASVIFQIHIVSQETTYTEIVTKQLLHTCTMHTLHLSLMTKGSNVSVYSIIVSFYDFHSRMQIDYSDYVFIWI